MEGNQAIVWNEVFIFDYWTFLEIAISRGLGEGIKKYKLAVTE